MDFERELKEHIKNICNDLGFIFIDASIHGHKNKQNIKVIADTEKGITLDECQKLSREISDIIFRKDLIYSDYRLDVSSPGLDKPLQYDYEFKRNIGKNLIVSYENDSNNFVETIGELIDYKNNSLILKVNDALKIIEIKKINKAKIKLKW